MRFSWLMFLGVMLFISPESLSAADFATLVTDSIKTYETVLAGWSNVFISVAEYLFAIFVPIEMILMFGPKMLKGDIELSSTVAELIRLILIFGLMWYLIHAAADLTTIFDSFKKIASDATGGIDLDTLFQKVGTLYTDIWKTIGKMNLWDDFGAIIMLIVVGFMIILSIITLVGIAVKNNIFALLAIYISPIFFAMGVFNITRPWTQSGLLLIIKYSAKYMAVLLIIGIALGTLEKGLTDVAADFTSNKNLIMLLFYALITMELTKAGEQIVDGMFSGMHNGSGSVMGSTTLGAAGATAFAASKVAKPMAGAVGAAAGAGIGLIKSDSSSAWGKAKDSFASSVGGAKMASSPIQSAKGAIFKAADDIKKDASKSKGSTDTSKNDQNNLKNTSKSGSKSEPSGDTKSNSSKPNLSGLPTNTGKNQSGLGSL